MQVGVVKQLRSAAARAALGACALAVVIAGAETHAQQSPTQQAPTQQSPTQTTYERVSGSWELATSDDEAQARLERGIESAVEGMPPLVDAIAARTLRERVRIPRRIDIRATPAEITVSIDGRGYTTAPGVPVDSTAPGGGESMRVTQLFRGENLEQSFQTPDGSKWNTYVIEGDRLRFDAVVTSRRLPGQVRFSLTFRRVR